MREKCFPSRGERNIEEKRRTRFAVTLYLVLQKGPASPLQALRSPWSETCSCPGARRSPSLSCVLEHTAHFYTAELVIGLLRLVFVTLS